MSHDSRFPAPAPAKAAAWIAIAQCALGLVYAGILLVRQALGKHDAAIVSEGKNNMQWVGLGTAVFMILVFGAVVAGAVALLTRASRWGRGPIVVVEILFLPIAWQMAQGGATLAAVALGLSALAALALSFHRASIDWAARSYGA